MSAKPASRFCWRPRGHYEPDDQSYVDSQELTDWRAKDPIKQFQEHLLERRTLTTSDIERIGWRIGATIEQAVAYANASPFPELSELTTDVYA